MARKPKRFQTGVGRSAEAANCMCQATSTVAVVAMVAALPAMISPSAGLAVKSRGRPVLLEVSTRRAPRHHIDPTRQRRRQEVRMHVSGLDIRLDLPSLAFNEVAPLISGGSTAGSPTKAFPCASSTCAHVKAGIAALKSEKVVTRWFGCSEQASAEARSPRGERRRLQVAIAWHGLRSPTQTRSQVMNASPQSWECF